MPHHELPPSAWVCRHAAALPRGARVLDVACGRLRHAAWFASRGCRVTAVDIAPIDASVRAAGIEFVRADLENAPWPFGGREFDAIVVTNYLHRPLFEHLIGGLAAGGLLIYETFAAGNERLGKPTNSRFLLQPGELLNAFGGSLRVLEYEHGEVTTPRPAVVQRLAACRAG